MPVKRVREMTSGGTYLIIGLGVGIGVGVGVAYLVQRMRATPQPSISTGNITSFTRDEQGRIIEILEKNIYGQSVG